MTDTPNNTLRKRLEDGKQNIQEMLRIIQEHPHMQVMGEEAMRITQQIRDAIGGTAHGVLEKMPTRLREKIERLPSTLQKMIRVGSYGIAISLAACSRKNTAESAMEQTQERLQAYSIKSDSESMLDWVNGGENWIEQGITSIGEKWDWTVLTVSQEAFFIFAMWFTGLLSHIIKKHGTAEGDKFPDEIASHIGLGILMQMLLEGVTDWNRLANMLTAGGVVIGGAALKESIKKWLQGCS